MSDEIIQMEQEIERLELLHLHLVQLVRFGEAAKIVNRQCDLIEQITERLRHIDPVVYAERQGN